VIVDAHHVQMTQIHEVVDLKFCEPCHVWHVDGDHGVQCDSPVEPNMIEEGGLIDGKES
jgi:hypothetical protein